MNPDQALELLYSATTLAKLTKEDHIKCEQARATIKRSFAAQQEPTPAPPGNEPRKGRRKKKGK